MVEPLEPDGTRPAHIQARMDRIWAAQEERLEVQRREAEARDIGRVAELGCQQAKQEARDRRASKWRASPVGRVVIGCKNALAAALAFIAPFGTRYITGPAVSGLAKWRATPVARLIKTQRGLIVMVLLYAALFAMRHFTGQEPAGSGYHCVGYDYDLSGAYCADYEWIEIP